MVRTCSGSYIYLTLALVNYSSVVILPVFKFLTTYISKSTMGVADSSKGPSSASITCSENFKFNPNYVNRYFTKILSCLTLEESSTWYFHVTNVFALSSGKMKSTLTLISVVTFSACVCHYITEYLSKFIFQLDLPLQPCNYTHCLIEI